MKVDTFKNKNYELVSHFVIFISNKTYSGKICTIDQVNKGFIYLIKRVDFLTSKIMSKHAINVFNKIDYFINKHISLLLMNKL